MKRISLWGALIVISLISSGCGGVGQASPEGVVKLAIQARANNDRERFGTLIIEGKDWLWDKIQNCDGKSLPDFIYEIEEMQYFGENLTVVHVYDGNRDNGGFAVTQVGNQWYLGDWIGEVSCE